MKRRLFLRGAAPAGVAVAASAAASSFPAPAIAQAMPEIKWRCTSSFPKSLDTIYGAAEQMAKRVAAATDNKFQIQVFAAGEIVPAFQVVDAVQAATVECGWSTRRPASAYVELIGRVLAAGGAIRRAGSGALGLVDVAAGRVEAYTELHINSWDCAAGIVLVQEAGGFTNDFFAGDGLRSGNPLIATNAALCGKLAGVIGIPISR